MNLSEAWELALSGIDNIPHKHRKAYCNNVIRKYYCEEAKP